jgi:hypothetical protein
MTGPRDHPLVRGHPRLPPTRSRPCLDTHPAFIDDSKPAEAEGLLERLVDAQLVEAAGQDQAGQLRYRLHDLLRLFARERLQLEEPGPAQQASLERVLSAYLALAEWADVVLEPSGLAYYGSDPARGRRADHPAVATIDHDPLRWLEAERPSLVAAVEQACHAGLGELGWRLAATLAGFFEIRAYWDDWQHTHSLALAAARRTTDRDAQGRLLGNLGDLHMYRYRMEDAICCLQQSLEAFRETGVGSCGACSPSARSKCCRVGSTTPPSGSNSACRDPGSSVGAAGRRRRWSPLVLCAVSWAGRGRPSSALSRAWH